MHFMKKNVLFPLFLLFVSFIGNATIHSVNVANFSFSPSTIDNVFVGDTIRWVWVSGSHTTTCDPATQGAGNSLPAGAATWNSPMDVTNPTFDYVVTVAGDYKYFCIPHQPNMSGSFTASNALPVSLTTFQLAGINS